MTSSISEVSPKRTIIQKVIVLGENPALMAGFVNRASGSNIAYHLYSSLGVGIGVARTSTMSEVEVIMQLWLIPHEEKVPGINANFRRGYTGAIIVVSGADIERIQDHLSSLNEEAISTSIIAVVGTHEEASRARDILSQNYGRNGRLFLHSDIDQAVEEIGVSLYSRYNDESSEPLIIRLDSSQCPEYHYVPGQAYLPECTQEDTEYIRFVAERIGATISAKAAIIDHDIGRFEVNLKSGGVVFRPSICKHCSRACKRESRICIIGVDRGWASDSLGDRALLIIAKIWSLVSREIPRHVQKQIRFASQCREYHKARDDTLHEDALFVLGYQRGIKKKTLLEEAGERVTTKRMSSSAFEVLKNKLQYIRGTDSQDGS